MWAVMFFGPLARLTHLAGGLTPFDIRPRGYSYAEVRAFLEAIGEQGRAYYASPELVIDTFYPPLYAVSRGLALWWLTMPGRVREAPLPLKVRYALVAVPHPDGKPGFRPTASARLPQARPSALQSTLQL
jgi:hypothetical protein